MDSRDAEVGVWDFWLESGDVAIFFGGVRWNNTPTPICIGFRNISLALQ